MIHTYNEILFWLKKKGNFDIEYNMDEYYPKWNKPITERPNCVWIHFSEAPRIVKFIDTESRMVVVLGWGKGGTDNYCLIGRKFQCARWKFSEDGGCRCLNKSVPVLNTTEMHTDIY